MEIDRHQRRTPIPNPHESTDPANAMISEGSPVTHNLRSDQKSPVKIDGFLTARHAQDWENYVKDHGD